MHSIKQQIKRERLQLNQVTNKKAKEILKKLGYNKYYEHIPFIKDKLGTKPPIMSPDLEERLCNLFMDIQGPYAKYCPEDRVNFLNYYYTVYKLCELLDQNQFLPYFPMLKDREKRIEQDEIWRKICMELDWEFIPTCNLLETTKSTIVKLFIGEIRVGTNTKPAATGAQPCLECSVKNAECRGCSECNESDLIHERALRDGERRNGHKALNDVLDSALEVHGLNHEIHVI